MWLMQNVFNHNSCQIIQYFLSKLVKYKKRLLLRCIHHFKSDLINNMDHMRISGNEPSSVILGQIILVLFLYCKLIFPVHILNAFVLAVLLYRPFCQLCVPLHLMVTVCPHQLRCWLESTNLQCCQSCFPFRLLVTVSSTDHRLTTPVW